MKTLNCAEVEALVDLLAAGECDAAVGKAVRTHLAGCPACAARAARAREVVGLLDLHYRQDAALARLRAKVQREAAAPRLLRFPGVVQRWAGIAALVLVTFGLGLSLAPAPRPGEGPGELLAVRGELEPPPAPPAVRGHALSRAKEGAAFAARMKKVEKPKRGSDLPLPPRVGVRVLVRNPGRRALHVEVLGWSLAMQGPGVVRAPAPGPAPGTISRERVTIPPGKSEAIRLGRLAERIGGRWYYLYPTAPGDYALKVALLVLAWEEGRQDRARQTILRAGPLALHVDDVH
jgi:hypothetical protein